MSNVNRLFGSQPEQEKRSQHSKDLGLELERINRAGIAVVNNRDWTYSTEQSQEVLAHLTPTWSVTHNQRSELTLDESMKTYRQWAEASPAYRIEVLSTSSDIDFQNGTANVHMQVDIHDLNASHQSVVLRGYNLFRWRRQRQDSGEVKWRCWHMSTMRVPGHGGLI